MKRLIERLRALFEADKRGATTFKHIIKDVEGDMQHMMRRANKGRMSPVGRYIEEHPNEAKRIAEQMTKIVNKSVSPKQKKQLKKWLGIHALPAGIPTKNLSIGAGLFARGFAAYEQEVSVDDLQKNIQDQIGPVMLYIESHESEARRVARMIKKLLNRAAKSSRNVKHRAVPIKNEIVAVQLFAKAFYDAEIS